ncbi:MAG: ChaN family lipoprotein [Planctomycetes bacterium]|nr:ChaN family lipoprotein [Planctomycetota bacterium]
MRRFVSLLLALFLPLTACTTRPSQTGTPARDLERYKAEHYAAVPTIPRKLVSLESLEADLGAGGLLLIGDVHDDAGLHARVTTLLERLTIFARRTNRACRLFVEFVGTEDEQLLEDWLAGRTELQSLRASLRDRWSESWLEGGTRIDAAFYRGLLRFARDHALAVRPLEPIPRLPLELRDLAMATTILAARNEGVRTLDIVLVGHAHLLGDGHLVDALGVTGRRASVILPDFDPTLVRGAPLALLAPRLYRWTAP